ncbi:hypothetical protein E4U13_001259 [Claviceps humidiphila]|uniref:Uncharacterized protein n=1 Tax=Claviceps humidiphila TaxID=1294629 RepID=A0A9P7TTX0_9HYPO|nr:hypothetical protein E4U32_001938 [Claviceps aff. humidiphila group G2b]KAG6117188.1 hypothetical protein E4U13_001259 [Claviceps humidiphila]
MLAKQRHGWKGDLVRSVESLQVLVVEYALVTQNRCFFCDQVFNFLSAVSFQQMTNDSTSVVALVGR